ncbi:MAG: class C sortase [Peptoniphilus sp.]|nr:class C sortase [Peptoniphilus sp.]
MNLETQFEQGLSNKIENEKVEKVVQESQEDHVLQNDLSDIDKELRDEIPNSAVGVIRIDKIGVLMPILDNTSEKALLRGAGLLEETDLPSSKDNTIAVLAGHRGGRNESLSFIKIDKLINGDQIKITTAEETLYYSVVGWEVIEPNDWSKFTREEDKAKLILMACHPYPKNDKRLLIKSELIDSKTTDEIAAD